MDKERELEAREALGPTGAVSGQKPLRSKTELASTDLKIEMWLHLSKKKGTSVFCPWPILWEKGKPQAASLTVRRLWLERGMLYIRIHA